MSHDAFQHFLKIIEALMRCDGERIVVNGERFRLLAFVALIVVIAQVVGPFPIAVRKTWPTKP